MMEIGILKKDFLRIHKAFQLNFVSTKNCLRDQKKFILSCIKTVFRELTLNKNLRNNQSIKANMKIESIITPVLLFGGLGTRLWPLSRKSYSKQFSRFIGEKTLFQASVQRLTSSDIIGTASHITLTNSDFRF